MIPNGLKLKPSSMIQTIPPKNQQSNEIRYQKKSTSTIKLYVRDTSGTWFRFHLFIFRCFLVRHFCGCTPNPSGLAAWFMATGLYWMDGKFWRWKKRHTSKPARLLDIQIGGGLVFVVVVVVAVVWMCFLFSIILPQKLVSSKHWMGLIVQQLMGLKNSLSQNSLKLLQPSYYHRSHKQFQG